jgi:hypothetical protein
MKKFLLLLTCLFIISLYACSDDMKEEEEEMMEEDVCDGTSFTYTNAIKSIVDANCALSGCHNGSTNLPDFTSYAGIQASASDAAARTRSGSMPPVSSGRELSDEQINTIMCWVEAGAPE